MSSLQVRAGLSKVPRGLLISSTSVFIEERVAKTSSIPSGSSKGWSPWRNSSNFSSTSSSMDRAAPSARLECLRLFRLPSLMGRGSTIVAGGPWRRHRKISNSRKWKKHNETTVALRRPWYGSLKALTGGPGGPAGPGSPLGPTAPWRIAEHKTCVNQVSPRASVAPLG